jgi:hypothetical protein
MFVNRGQGAILGLPTWFWLAMSFIVGGNVDFLIACILVSGRGQNDD